MKGIWVIIIALTFFSGTLVSGTIAFGIVDQCDNDPPRGINNGKPFLEIWEAICDLQNQVNNISQNTDTLGELDCVTTQIAKFNVTGTEQWECAVDNDTIPIITKSSVMEFSSGTDKIGTVGVGFYSIGQGHVGPDPNAPIAKAFTTKVVLPVRGTISNLVAEVNFSPSEQTPVKAVWRASVAGSPSGSDVHLGTNTSCIIFSNDNTCTDEVNTWVFTKGQGVVITFVPLAADAPIAEATASVLFTPQN